MKVGSFLPVVLALGCVPLAAQTQLSADCQAGSQPACVRLARAGGSIDMRLAAVRKLTDQAALADLAKTGADRAVRLAAIRGLIDQAALTRLALESKGAVERGAAIERLLDEEVVAGLARKDTSKWVRRKAANCLTDAGLIAKLVAENRKDLFPTLTIVGGLKHVRMDGKEVADTLLGIVPILPGRHTIAADFTVLENVIWEPGSVTSIALDARLGTSYTLEAEVGIVHWDYVAPRTRKGRGTWKLVATEEISPGPDLLPQLLKR